MYFIMQNIETQTGNTVINNNNNNNNIYIYIYIYRERERERNIPREYLN